MTQLARTLGLGHAVLLGLGSILGTGVFVSIVVAAGIAGDGIVAALVIAGILAMANGLSSAALASNYPVSGGTYEYAYQTLSPWFGRAAGLTFLVAKSASCAAAAIALIDYATQAFYLEAASWTAKPLAVAAVVALTALVARGAKRTSTVNAVMVGCTLAAIGMYLLLVWSDRYDLRPWTRFIPTQGTWQATLGAAAFLFVAYTGYGRIATLGEEVTDPRRTIPLAVVITLALTMALYVAVAAGTLGAVRLDYVIKAGSAGSAPLAELALSLTEGKGFIARIVTFGSLTALVGVILNLILGLSRVVLAMGRRHDLPAWTSQIDATTQQPRHAVWLVGVAVVLIVLTLDFKTSWTFSAFSVLVYYAITNLAALRLPKDARRLPAAVPLLGLAGCLFLAYFAILTLISYQ